MGNQLVQTARQTGPLSINVLSFSTLTNKQYDNYKQAKVQHSYYDVFFYKSEHPVWPSNKQNFGDDNAWAQLFRASLVKLLIKN